MVQKLFWDVLLREKGLGSGEVAIIFHHFVKELSQPGGGCETPANYVHLGIPLLAGGRLEHIKFDKCLMQKEEQTNGFALKECEHLEDEAASWRKHPHGNQRLSKMKIGNNRLLKYWILRYLRYLYSKG